MLKNEKKLKLELLLLKVRKGTVIQRLIFTLSMLALSLKRLPVTLNNTQLRIILRKIKNFIFKSKSYNKNLQTD